MSVLHYFLLCLLAAFSSLSLAPPTLAETLEEAVQEMIRSNPDVRASAHNRLARDEEVRQARSGYFPTVDLEAGIGKDYVEQPFDDDLTPQQLNFSLRQNVFAGLSTMNEVERQKARVRSQAHLVGSTAENTALKTANVYIAVLNTEAQHALARENLLIHERIADQIALRSESGVASTADLDQVNSRLNLARANVVVTEQNFQDARTNYLAVVGHLPDTLTRPGNPDSFMPASREEAEQHALSGHPTLKSANADVQARIAQDKVARSPFMPVLDVELDQINEDETNYSFDRREDFRAVLRLRYNLFNGWKDHARKLETLELINEAREIRNRTQRQVIESIRLSWMAYQASANKLGYLQQRAAFAKKTADAYSRQFDIGKRTLLDVLDSEAERIDASQQLISAEYDLLYAQYRILNGMGGLVASLDLQWPEESLIEEEYAGETEEENSSS